MSESAVHDERSCEKIDGEFYLMASPSSNHQAIVSNIFGIFRAYLKGKTCRVFDGLSVVLDNGNTFIPDLLILCDRSKLKANAIHGAPEIVVEVLSPSTAKRDMDVKKRLYEKHGVKEYWIVDPFSRAMTVYHLKENIFSLESVYYYRTDEEQIDMPEDDKKCMALGFFTSLFADLEIRLEDVFEGLI